MPYNHAAVPTVDRKSSQDFYEKLDFTLLREWEKPAEELSATVMEKDGYILELVHHPTNTVSSPPKLVERQHIGVSVTELASLLSELETSGIKVLKPITKGVSVREFAFVADPSGNVVELVVEK